jgi:inorganic triphosphatase YgiF
MPDYFETELKLKILQPDGSGKVLQAFFNSEYIGQLAPENAWSITRMEAWYYDTADQSLQKSGIAYRVRREGDSWVAAVKANGSSDGGLHQRAEWNLASPDREPRPELFADLPIGVKLLETIGAQPLQPLFATVFDRYAAEVSFEAAQIEVAVDEGRILAGGLSEPIHEVELELKAGQQVALLKLGAAIAREIPLAPEPKSKYFRALLLAGLAEPQPKPVIDLPLQTELADALSLLMSVAIGKLFSAYQAFLEHPDQPRHAYQMRVKLRRLRSLLLFAKPCLAEEDFQTGKQLLAGWGRVFGPLRDLDVLAAQWEELCNSPYITFDSRPWLGDTIGKRRLAQLEQVNHSIGQGRLSAELLELWAWSEDHPWQPGEYPPTIGAFARWRIGGWLAALLDAGKTANWENDLELHALRLRLKRIRYTLAAMPFYADRRSIKLLAEIKTMQALFGILNDRTVANQLLASLARGATRAVYRDIGILSGWQGRGEQTARGQLQRQWRSFKQAAKRWLEA